MAAASSAIRVNMDARAIIGLVVIIVILVMGFDLNTLLGKE